MKKQYNICAQKVLNFLLSSATYENTEYEIIKILKQL
jgi:hypothetical protein